MWEFVLGELSVINDLPIDERGSAGDWLAHGAPILAWAQRERPAEPADSLADSVDDVAQQSLAELVHGVAQQSLAEDLTAYVPAESPEPHVAAGPVEGSRYQELDGAEPDQRRHWYLAIPDDGTTPLLTAVQRVLQQDELMVTDDPLRLVELEHHILVEFEPDIVADVVGSSHRAIVPTANLRVMGRRRCRGLVRRARLTLWYWWVAVTRQCSPRHPRMSAGYGPARSSRPWSTCYRARTVAQRSCGW